MEGCEKNNIGKDVFIENDISGDVDGIGSEIKNLAFNALRIA